MEGVTLDPVDDGESLSIRFEYVVAGVRHVVEDRSGTFTRRGARAGRKVTVYYLEESPGRGRLVERTVAFGAVLLIVLGLAIGGMTVAIAVRDGGL